MDQNILHFTIPKSGAVYHRCRFLNSKLTMVHTIRHHLHWRHAVKLKITQSTVSNFGHYASRNLLTNWRKL